MSDETYQVMLDQLDRTISMYQWTVGIFITIILAAVGFFGVVQWRMKKEQEEKIKSEISENFSADIAEVLGPIIADALKQKRLLGHPDYKSNIELWEGYLSLNSKYSFSEEVRNSILNYKLFIMKNFVDQLRAKTNMPLNNAHIHNEYMSIVNENDMNGTLIPPEELTKIMQKVTKENQEKEKENYDEEVVNLILADYQKFYYDYKDP